MHNPLSVASVRESVKLGDFRPPCLKYTFLSACIMLYEQYMPNFMMTLRFLDFNNYTPRFSPEQQFCSEMRRWFCCLAGGIQNAVTPLMYSMHIFCADALVVKYKHKSACCPWRNCLRGQRRLREQAARDADRSVSESQANKTQPPS